MQFCCNLWRGSYHLAALLPHMLQQTESYVSLSFFPLALALLQSCVLMIMPQAVTVTECVTGMVTGA